MDTWYVNIHIHAAEDNLVGFTERSITYKGCSVVFYVQCRHLVQRTVEVRILTSMRNRAPVLQVFVLVQHAGHHQEVHRHTYCSVTNLTVVVHTDSSFYSRDTILLYFAALVFMYSYMSGTHAMRNVHS